MDFIRAVGKAVFADFPEQEVRKVLMTDYSDTRFEAVLMEVLANTNTEFSRTEVRRIIDLAKSKWFGNDTRNSSDFDRGILNPEYLYGILTAFGEECLDTSWDFPRVKFEYLLRWHDLTYRINEDTVVIPSIVMNDLRRHRKYSDRKFAWPDILNHDNVVINRVLDKGLADTHAHLNATSDVFTLNWLSMMNSRTALKSMAERMEGENYLSKAVAPMESYSTNPVNSMTKSFYNLGLCAALCRSWLFVLDKEDESLDSNSMTRRIYSLLSDFINEDTTLFSRLSTQIYEHINLLRTDALRTPKGRIIDYAITEKGMDNPSSPYFIHSGERRLLYTVFNRIFTGKGDTVRTSKVLYLYIILKNRLRSEFVQMNNLVGFENFQIYQSRKSEFFKDPLWWDLNLSYAVLSSLDINGSGALDSNQLEGRITPDALEDIHKAVIKSPFGEREYKLGNLENLKGFSLVVHYIKKDLFKSNKSRSRQLAKFRKELWRDMNIIMKYLNGRVSGIDVAGSELNCRPEIFAPMFRWAKANGLGNNMTFHAGEDFYDLLDGLRTIYEAVIFMNFDSGCRIGHGLAMGKDAATYYAGRHFRMIAPAQIVLDNLIWMKYFAAEEGVILSDLTLNFIHTTTRDLFGTIGYEFVDSLDYWRSMLMRGNDVDFIDEDSNPRGFTLRSLTSKPDFIKHNFGWTTKVGRNATELYKQYEMSGTIFIRGREVFETKIPYTFAEDVKNFRDRY